MEDKAMKYEEFKEYLVQRIKDYLPAKYIEAEVSVRPINKNNTILDSLFIKNENQNTIPTIYIEDFYKELENGQKNLHEVLSTIADTYVKNMRDFDIKSITQKDYVLDNVTPRLINKECNENTLSEYPHKDMGDFTCVYQVMVNEYEDGSASYKINNSFLEKLDIPLDELHEMAVKNAMEKSPVKIQSMYEVLSDMGVDEASLPPIEEIQCAMTVITNEGKTNGANVILYDGVLDEISDRVGGDVILLPSSVHEWLAIKDDGNTDYSLFESMVKEVNLTQVVRQEQLSDTVYHYDSKDKVFERCDEFVDRMKNKELEKPSKDKGIKDILEDGKRRAKIQNEIKPKNPNLGKQAELV